MEAAQLAQDSTTPEQMPDQPAPVETLKIPVTHPADIAMVSGCEVSQKFMSVARKTAIKGADVVTLLSMIEGLHNEIMQSGGQLVAAVVRDGIIELKAPRGAYAVTGAGFTEAGTMFIEVAKIGDLPEEPTPLPSPETP